MKKTNTISERDFAKLDRLLREKPHATMLSLEAHILFSNNKPRECLESKSPDELKLLMETAKKSVPKHKQKFKERLATIQAHRTETQQKQKSEASSKAEALTRERENNYRHDPVWLMADRNEGLKIAKSETQKRQSLKAQLRFRKNCLTTNV